MSENFIGYYYVCADLTPSTPKTIQMFEQLNEAIEAYNGLPNNQVKALGVQNTAPQPGSLDFVQCHNGKNVLIQDYEKLSAWRNPEILRLVNQLRDSMPLEEQRILRFITPEYDDLFSVVKNEDGDIEMVQANSPEINMIAREIANLAQANLDELGLKEISIPIGTFTGLALLMGLGPDVTISVMPIGSALCDFVSYFTSAGINQTLHKIYIDVHATINIVTPIDEPTITVKAEVLVAENLIVGNVPQFYFGGTVQNGGFLDLAP